METIQKIIVVDDEKSICSNVEKILKKSNYEVVHAISADEAMEKMAMDSFSLLISDIVMPGKNGLELLKLVKKQWPLTKAVMMTAYASTETAVKAIRLGALDYIPKPFTPDELRSTVEKALKGGLKEAPTTENERETIDVIDIDMPFDADEVARYTGEEYAKNLGPSDMPVIEVKLPEPLEGYCEMGIMVCDIFKKLSATCKAGTKTQKCPQLAKKKRAANAKKTPDIKKLIGIDQPFDYEEVASVTGPEYVQSLQSEGVAYVP
ncbi:MAG: sigma-54-dependent Fis family transcriptional regulator, partial [Deltaproteobacteria bacterium]|nr:sigma-54-dependent Fis family transcriptional regulator [Deltaproteobacteria bacterium]